MTNRRGISRRTAFTSGLDGTGLSRARSHLSRCSLKHQPRPEAVAVVPLIVKDHFARPFCSFPGGLVTPGLCGKTGWRHADPRTQAFSGDVTARSPTKNKWVKQRTTASMQRGQPVHQQFRGWNATRALYRKFLAISAWLRFSVRRSSQPFSANTKREPEQHAARPRSIASTVQHRFRGTAPLGSRRSLLSANSPRVRRWSPQPFSPIKDAARPAHGTSSQHRHH